MRSALIAALTSGSTATSTIRWTGNVIQQSEIVDARTQQHCDTTNTKSEHYLRDSRMAPT